MHSHDRTMLAKFGFADVDKKLPLHDLACQYLAETENARKIFELYILPDYGERLRYLKTWEEGDRGYADGLRVFVESSALISFSKSSPRFEIPISKGTGQYMTTVGFLDLGLNVESSRVAETQKTIKFGYPPRTPPPWRAALPEEINGNEKVVCESVTFQSTNDFFVAIEVKITPIAASEIIRQIKLYREYRSAHTWLCPTHFDLGKRDVDMLKSEGIHHIRLGAKFDEWAKTAPMPSDSTIEM